jgi:hypothetical protein
MATIGVRKTGPSVGRSTMGSQVYEREDVSVYNKAAGKNGNPAILA